MVGAKTLESIVKAVNVSPPIQAIRISPVAATIAGACIPLLATGIALSGNDSLIIKSLGTLAFSFGFGAATIGAALYACGAAFYKRAIRLMENPSAKNHLAEIFEPGLYHYCNRNGSYAAAVKTGFGKEFKQINEGYKGKKRNTWLPGV